MMNLLPPPARKELVKEYWLRVASVWMLLFSAVLVAVGALLIPSYFLMQFERAALETERAALRAEDSEAVAAERIVRDSNALASELQKREMGSAMTAIVDAVQRAVPEGVEVRSYSISRSEENAIEEVRISGEAATRDALIAFRDALEKENLFASAEVPIGDLVREEDLPFEIIISIAEASTES